MILFENNQECPQTLFAGPSSFPTAEVPLAGGKGDSLAGANVPRVSAARRTGRLPAARVERVRRRNPDQVVPGVGHHRVRDTAPVKEDQGEQQPGYSG